MSVVLRFDDQFGIGMCVSDGEDVVRRQRQTDGTVMVRPRVHLTSVRVDGSWPDIVERKEGRKECIISGEV